MVSLPAGLYGSTRRSIRWTRDYVRFRLNRGPIIVLGNQKSGTSAIAHLLADCCGLSKTVDIPVVWERIPQLASGQIRLTALARSAPGQFTADVIKEPHLTFAFDEVLRTFPAATHVFVVRDPRDNIRSILDRLDLPGDTDSLDPDHELPPGWAPVLYHGGGPAGDDGGLVRRLAARWRDAVGVYYRAEAASVDVHLVRYEDFLEDKEAYIRELARRVGRRPGRSISNRVDVQFQPRGSHRGLGWESFYSRRNLAIIEELCGREMDRLGYDRVGAGT